jgi:AraC-like DNA-binding protein
VNTIIYSSATGGPSGRRLWADALANLSGLECRMDSMRSSNCMVRQWRAGQLNLSDAQLAWQSVHHGTSRNDDYLLLKQVQSGTLTLEQNGRQHRIGAGGMLLVDPLRGFSERFGDPTRVIVLHIPRKALRDRGLPSGLQNVYIPDPVLPDVQAVRDYVSFTVQQANTVSNRLLERLGNQCVELLDVILDDAAETVASRSAAATAIRARQTIARLLDDPDLCVDRIAAELNLSANYLSRVFREEGLSPMRYAWTLRLDRAAQLLADTPTHRLQSKEIAFRCGFSSASNFSRAFKDRYGMSPLAYAQHARLQGETAGRLAAPHAA